MGFLDALIDVPRDIIVGPGADQLSMQEKFTRGILNTIVLAKNPAALPAMHASYAQQDAATRNTLQSYAFQARMKQVGYKKAAEEYGIPSGFDVPTTMQDVPLPGAEPFSAEVNGPGTGPSVIPSTRLDIADLPPPAFTDELKSRLGQGQLSVLKSGKLGEGELWRLMGLNPPAGVIASEAADTATAASQIPGFEAEKVTGSAKGPTITGKPMQRFDSTVVPGAVVVDTNGNLVEEVSPGNWQVKSGQDLGSMLRESKQTGAQPAINAILETDIRTGKPVIRKLDPKEQAAEINRWSQKNEKILSAKITSRFQDVQRAHKTLDKAEEVKIAADEVIGMFKKYIYNQDEEGHPLTGEPALGRQSDTDNIIKEGAYLAKQWLRSLRKNQPGNENLIAMKALIGPSATILSKAYGNVNPSDVDMDAFAKALPNETDTVELAEMKLRDFPATADAIFRKAQARAKEREAAAAGEPISTETGETTEQSTETPGGATPEQWDAFSRSFKRKGGTQ